VRGKLFTFGNSGNFFSKLQSFYYSGDCKMINDKMMFIKNKVKEKSQNIFETIVHS
jgi:hypothetical protein